MEKNPTNMKPDLKKVVLQHSVSKEIEIAAAEWYINYFETIPDSTCVCNQEHCKYIFHIKNYLNHETLSPIGSSCMDYFNWNEQESEILRAYNMWHDKPYNNVGGVYNGVAFNIVIKDVDFIRSIKYSASAENRRLCTYARLVWIHNPPVIPVKEKPILIKNQPYIMPIKKTCDRCEIQRQKGYKRCYQCNSAKYAPSV
jgi:hypothetical protein